MEVLTGPPLLHATDVVAVNHGAGRILCSNFSVVGNRTFSGGSVKASIRINGRPTELFMLQNAQGSHFEFPGGNLLPDESLLAALPLQFGMNTLEFHTGSEGSPGEGVTASASLWLWTASDRVVVVDIDGTITKSDVRGLLANQVQGTASFLSNALASSNPWTSEAIMNTARSADYNHEGVADAISSIARKGYRILYLTARPISMAAGSRTYLQSVSQSAGSKMPDGALITQPHGTIKALQTKHDDFKISVLEQIQSLFEADQFSSLFGAPQNRRSVFAGGFGNSDTDIVAYDSAGIPRTHIFVADKSSRIKNCADGAEFQSYTGLMPHLDAFFPGKDVHPYSAPAPAGGARKPYRRSSSEPQDEGSILSHVTSRLEDILPLSGKKSPVSPPRSWHGPGPEAQLERPSQPSSDSTPHPDSAADKPWSARRFVESLVPGCSGPRLVTGTGPGLPQEVAAASGIPSGEQPGVHGQDLFQVKGGQPQYGAPAAHGPGGHPGGGGWHAAGAQSMPHARYANSSPYGYSPHGQPAAMSGQHPSQTHPQRRAGQPAGGMGHVGYPPGGPGHVQGGVSQRPGQGGGGATDEWGRGMQQHVPSQANQAPAQPEQLSSWERQQRQEAVDRAAAMARAGSRGGVGPSGVQMPQRAGPGVGGGGRGAGAEMVNVFYNL